MNIIILSLNHYKMVFNKALTYADKRITDIDYCYPLSSGMNEKRIKHLIKDWYRMNVVSYNYRHYKKVGDIEINSVLSSIDNWNSENIKDEPCSPYQMLKLLECIYYQIELDSLNAEEREQYKTSLHLLNRAINNIRDSIISQMDEYKKASRYIF